MLFYTVICSPICYSGRKQWVLEKVCNGKNEADFLLIFYWLWLSQVLCKRDMVMSLRAKPQGLCPPESSLVNIFMQCTGSQSLPAVKLPIPLFKLRQLFGDLARSRWFCPSRERSAEGEITFAVLLPCGPSPLEGSHPSLLLKTWFIAASLVPCGVWPGKLYLCKRKGKDMCLLRECFFSSKTSTIT